MAFDPWNAPVLLPRELRHGEQAALDAIDLQGVQHLDAAPGWMNGFNGRACGVMAAT